MWLFNWNPRSRLSCINSLSFVGFVSRSPLPHPPLSYVWWYCATPQHLHLKHQAPQPPPLPVRPDPLYRSITQPHCHRLPGPQPVQGTLHLVRLPSSPTRLALLPPQPLPETQWIPECMDSFACRPCSAVPLVGQRRRPGVHLRCSISTSGLLFAVFFHLPVLQCDSSPSAVALWTRTLLLLLHGLCGCSCVSVWLFSWTLFLYVRASMEGKLHGVFISTWCCLLWVALLCWLLFR